ncbi:MAG: acyl-CoA thioesterase [Anaerolineae bacterium]|nr:acyl-CoA thioesterase [Anaerolineae bacterium]
MMKIESLPRVTASHLVKSVDLNHHGTLYAGRMAEWVVEVGFMTARAALECSPQNIVCVRLHGMDFRESVDGGETLVLEGRTAYVGRSSLTVYVQASKLHDRKKERVPTDGFVTFVHIKDGKATPHELEVEAPETEEAQQIWMHIANERSKRQGK